jgi:AcrR family transcriptional regulator
MGALHKPSDHRGEITRERILDVAISMFANCGFEGASTRHMAAEAGVNQPAIQYHFTSKDGLYRAAVERIAGDVRDQMAETNALTAKVLENPDATDHELEAALCRALDRFADIVLEDHGRENWSMFIARAEIEDQTALAALSEELARSIVRPISQLVGRILPHESEYAAMLRALSLIGMVSAFKNRCVHGAIRKALGWEKLGPLQVSEIKALVRNQINAILTAARKATS